MFSLIAVLLLSVLFGKNALGASENETTTTSEADIIISVGNLSLFPLNFEEHQLLHGRRTTMNPLIGSDHPEEANRTELPVAVTPSTIVDGSDVSNHTEIMEDDHYHTESRFDSKGCDTHLRNKHEEDCYENFEDAIEESAEIEDEAERGKRICCASEGYERCCVIGYMEANCEADRNAIKENLKAARIFMATLSNTSCSLHRGKCDFDSAASQPSLSSFLLVTLGLLLAVLIL
ncbi:uncharacterized protein LOC129961701 [Argiope bruennichi]|uniref:Uncharacterized protein n=1 Tax=Argiope bruennichi TaxID=94029 RepID=A0A8T0FVI0_ARGBR|nr:uncharacterized protein LOC129961701 [Argiope bruennichi]KAF8793659.1 hypothetical protein HNY73_001710 [Argiope bruennichi]